MNEKQAHLNSIVNIVVDCCAIEIDDKGTMSITREDVIGKSRAENVVMTRAILCRMIAFAGYSTTTTAMLLGRTEAAVRHLLKLAMQFHATSRAYRIAEAEATLKCKDLPDSGI